MPCRDDACHPFWKFPCISLLAVSQPSMIDIVYVCEMRWHDDMIIDASMAGYVS